VVTRSFALVPEKKFSERRAFFIHFYAMYRIKQRCRHNGKDNEKTMKRQGKESDYFERRWVR